MISFILYLAITTGYGRAIDLDSSVITMEGDIMIQKGFEGVDGLSSSALSDPRLLWPTSQVFYIMDNKFGIHERKLLLNVINEVESRTCLIFSESVGSGAYINITRTDQRGCESFIGYKGEMQEMFLNKDCFRYRGTLLHELMHALGFVHEHTRPDRDDFVDIIWDNIEPTEHARNNFYKRGSHEVHLFNTYAYDSVMHYGETFFSKNGKPTIVPKKRGVKLGGGNHLSETDVERINQLYSCKISMIAVTAKEEEETCFNDRPCCSSWKEMGECSRNATFMSKYCKASCAICSPKYNLEEDCSDRHPKCDKKMKNDGCQSNWMRENCRLTCNTCSTKDGLLDKCYKRKGHCREGWTFYEGNCYIFINESCSFSDAQDYCVDKGSYLISIHTKEENSFITDLMKNSNGERIWIGTYKDAEEDIWLHIDDTETNVFFWKTSEPKDETGRDRCAAITTGGKWVDVDCNERLTGFVCKKKKQQK